MPHFSFTNANIVRISVFLPPVLCPTILYPCPSTRADKRYATVTRGSSLFFSFASIAHNAFFLIILLPSRANFDRVRTIFTMPNWSRISDGTSPSIVTLHSHSVTMSTGILLNCRRMDAHQASSCAWTSKGSGGGAEEQRPIQRGQKQRDFRNFSRWIWKLKLSKVRLSMANGAYSPFPVVVQIDIFTLPAPLYIEGNNNVMLCAW